MINDHKKTNRAFHKKVCSVVLLDLKYRYYFAAGAAGAGAPGAGAAGAGAPGAGAPGAGAGAAASFLAGSAGFFSGADGQPTNVSVRATNIRTERIKANTLFINVVLLSKIFIRWA